MLCSYFITWHCPQNTDGSVIPLFVQWTGGHWKQAGSRSVVAYTCCTFWIVLRCVFPWHPNAKVLFNSRNKAVTRRIWQKKSDWSTLNVILTHLSLCVTFPITFSGRLWLQLVEQWVVQCPKGRRFKSHVEVSFGKTLNSKLLLMGLAKESAIQVQSIYHLAQMDAHDQSEGFGKSFTRRAGRSAVLLRWGTRRENFYFLRLQQQQKQQHRDIVSQGWMSLYWFGR